MTVVVTRNVDMRVRGFLASTMLEIASGVYTSPNLSSAVRDRVWEVMEKWYVAEKGQGVVMTWPDKRASGGQVVRVLGEERLLLRETSAVVLSCRGLTESEVRSLTSMLEEPPF